MMDYSMVELLKVEELSLLAAEARKEIISVTQQNGGHLASNLGVVELTFALHYVFNSDDKLIFDVGHQCYAHKLITQSSRDFKTIRKKGGLSGFPNADEGDCFSMGHSSNSLSVAVGFARARDLLDDDYEIVSIVGDGALGGGEYFEALNDSAICGKHIIIINYNDYSIEKTVGRLQQLIKDEAFAEKFFNDFGYDYVHAVDGHDIGALVTVLKNAKESRRKTVIMVKTKKGYGMPEAEENPEKYHSVSVEKTTKSYAEIVGDTLLELALDNERIVAVTAAMTASTGLSEFAKQLPDRFFDVGICEQHAVTMCGAMAKGGLKPYFAVYGSFLARGIDQVINDVALQNLPVTFLVDHAGVVSDDGETHQGNLIIGLLAAIPNLNIISPQNKAELIHALVWSVNYNYPLVIKYPKGGDEVDDKEIGYLDIYNGCEAIDPNVEAVILTTGADMYVLGRKLQSSLSERGIQAKTINVYVLKPIDISFAACMHTIPMIVLEDNVSAGGYAERLISTYRQWSYSGFKLLSLTLPDAFIKTGTKEEIYAENGWGLEELTQKAEKFIKDATR